MENIIAFIVLINLLIIFFFNKISNVINVFDLPDKIRKNHKKKIASIGGFIFFLNISFAVFFHFIGILDLTINSLFETNRELLLFYISSASFFFIGLLDDKLEISANKKLFLICLVTFVYCTLDPSVQVNYVIFSTYLPSFTLNGFSIFATVLCFMLFMNAFNMFDGINLQSASYYLFFLCFLIYLFGFNFFLIVLMISCLFFLYLNYKNICFLGNNGSMYISFVLCVLTIKYNTNSSYIFFSDQIFLLMAIPGLELLRLAIFRIIKKKHPFKADQNHLHHLMLRSFGYAKTFFIIQFLIMSSNIIGVYYNITFIICFIIICIYCLLIHYLHKKTNF